MLIGTIKQLIPKMLQLPDDKKYELKTHYENRTNRQNRYLWELLTLCVEKSTGRKNKDDIDKLYINMLEYTGAKKDRLIIIPEALERLKQEIRLCVPIRSFKEHNKDFMEVEVIYGSSKLNTKEMGLLIDNILDYASNLDIDTNYWSELLKSEPRKKIKGVMNK